MDHMQLSGVNNKEIRGKQGLIHAGKLAQHTVSGDKSSLCKLLKHAGYAALLPAFQRLYLYFLLSNLLH